MMFLKEICVLIICFEVSFAGIANSTKNSPMSEAINIEKHVDVPSTANRTGTLILSKKESNSTSVSTEHGEESKKYNKESKLKKAFTITKSGNNSTLDTTIQNTFSVHGAHSADESTDDKEIHKRTDVTADGISLGKRHRFLNGAIIADDSKNQIKTSHHVDDSFEIATKDGLSNIAHNSTMNTIGVTDDTSKIVSSHFVNPTGIVDTTQISGKKNKSDTTTKTNEMLMHSVNPTRTVDIDRIQTVVHTRNTHDRSGKTIIKHISPLFFTLITDVNNQNIQNDLKNTNTSSIIQEEGSDGTSTTILSTQTTIEDKRKIHNNEFNFLTKPTDNSTLIPSLGVGISTTILDGHDYHKSEKTSTVKETTTPDEEKIKSIFNKETDVKYTFNRTPEKNPDDTFVIKANLRPDMQELEIKTESKESENIKPDKPNDKPAQTIKPKDKPAQTDKPKDKPAQTDKPTKTDKLADDSTTDGPMLLIIPRTQGKENSLEALKETIKQEKYIEFLKYISKSNFQSKVIVAGVNNVKEADLDGFLLNYSKEFPVFVVSMAMSNKTEEIYMLSTKETATKVTTLE